MRKVTAETCAAFEQGRSLKMGNTRTDGNGLYLHGNKIAWKDESGALWVSTCGWNTHTTRERLNGLTGVSVNQKRGVLFLNGEEWNGEPKKI